MFDALGSQSLEEFEHQFAAAWERAKLAARKSPLYFGGAIVPFKSPIDKAAAYAVMSMSCQEFPVWLHVCKTIAFSDEKIAEWEKKGICCIDLGSRKYHGNSGSATEWLVERYNLQRTAGVMKLIEVINKNNKTGYLKGFKNAVPHIMRELYELEPNDADWWSVKVFSEAAKVVAAFVRVANGESLRAPSVAPADVTKFANDFGDVDKPLTLGRYVWNLWILGEEFPSILEKLEFWLTGIKRLSEARQRAKAQVAEALAKGKLPTFYASRYSGVLLEKRDHFFKKEVLYSHKFAIRVMLEEDGHAAISTNKLDCAAFFDFLERREPGRWHHNVQMGALINGGPQYTENPPTGIPPRVLVELAKSFLAPKKKKK